MRLGFVGVGKWSQKLATAFRACGAEIVAYDRRQPSSGGSGETFWVTGPTGFGDRVPWRDQLADKSIDAIVAAGPPESTTEVAMACAAAGKPVCATKPLMRHPERTTAAFYVDFWRLKALEFAEMAFAARANVKPIEISLFGSGPIRSFPGMFDYGPHVLAAMLNIMGEPPTEYVDVARKNREDGGECFVATAVFPKRRVNLMFGNGFDISLRQLKLGERVYCNEIGNTIGHETKAEVIERFAAAFLHDVSESATDQQFVLLSQMADAELKKIRELAT